MQQTTDTIEVVRATARVFYHTSSNLLQPLKPPGPPTLSPMLRPHDLIRPFLAIRIGIQAQIPRH